MRILVVEDERISRVGLCEMLCELKPDSKVLSADSGDTALRLLAEASVDLIFLDIRMPGMDGLALLEQIRSDNAWVHVIMISAYDQFAYAQRAIQLGAMDFIVKPYAKDTIAQVIERVEERMSGLDIEDMFYTPELSRWLMQPGLQSAVLAEQLHLPNANAYAGRMYLLRAIEQGSYAHVHNQDKVMKWLFRQVKSAMPTGVRVIMSESEKMYTMVLLAQGKTCRLETSYLMDWLLQVRDIFEVELLCTESRFEDDLLSNLHQVYAQCKSQMECAFYLTTPCVITDGLLQLDSRRQLDGKLIDQLQEQIRKGDQNATRWALQEIRDEIARPPYMPVQRLQYALHIGFINILSNASINLSDTCRMSLAEQMAEIVQKSWTMDNFFKAYERLAVELAENINLVMSQQNAITIQHCLDYMQQHYDDPELNQDMLARKLHFSVGYFGNMFKKTTGETFVAYLNRLRIDAAKQLLTNSHLKVYEIAEQTGFTSVNYFIRVFKQYTLMSPNRYRMLYSVRGDRT